MVQALEERPPFVTFEASSIEDRQATLEARESRFRDVHIAWITPLGSKDRIPRIVDDWFPQLEQQVREGRFKMEWLSQYRQAYDYWKRGLEAPIHGTPLSAWPSCTPAMLRNLNTVGLRSVEDVATMNEEGIRRVGMGAQHLKQMAITWLESREKALPLEEVANLRTQLEQALQTIAAMQSAHEEMQRQLMGKRPETDDNIPDVKVD